MTGPGSGHYELHYSLRRGVLAHVLPIGMREEDWPVVKQVQHAVQDVFEEPTCRVQRDPMHGAEVDHTDRSRLWFE